MVEKGDMDPKLPKNAERAECDLAARSIPEIKGTDRVGGVRVRFQCGGNLPYGRFRLEMSRMVRKEVIDKDSDFFLSHQVAGQFQEFAGAHALQRFGAEKQTRGQHISRQAVIKNADAA